ncbi:hypothetical protein M0R45_012011 [Rubus argutus]|uniref:Uncharacterized protein n=1 Tax=Rubus argutus TaxID=59490 RepID=A0AAW1YCV4_RUBAR
MVMDALSVWVLLGVAAVSSDRLGIDLAEELSGLEMNCRLAYCDLLVAVNLQIDSSRLENVQKNLPRFSWTITAVYITSLLIHQTGLVSDIQDHQMGCALMCQNTISPPVDQNHHQPGLVPEFG